MKKKTISELEKTIANLQRKNSDLHRQVALAEDEQQTRDARIIELKQNAARHQDDLDDLLSTIRDLVNDKRKLAKVIEDMAKFVAEQGWLRS